MDDDDRDSNASSDNDQDEVMEDVDDGDADPDQDNDPEGDGDVDDDDNDDNDNDNENDNDGEDDDEDADEDEDNADQTGTQGVGDAADADADGDGGDATGGPEIKVEDVDEKIADRGVAGTDGADGGHEYQCYGYNARPEVLGDGGSDGYIRKYSGFETINGKQLLTVAQRHPFVDSVVKAGALVSYWENEEPPQLSAKGGPEEHVTSPVYSLAIQAQALWLLSGLESGCINLQSVRHDEGKRIHYLKQHTNAVSVLALSPDETTVLSGSWDKQILDWDLNQGTVSRSFTGSGGQISALERRPARGEPFSATAAHEPLPSDTFSTDERRGLSNGGMFSAGGGTSGVSGTDIGMGLGNANGDAGDAIGDAASPAHESLFGGSDAGSLFGETMGGGFGGGGGDDDDDEFSHAIGMSLEGDSMNAGNADGSADVTMTGIDSSLDITVDPPSQDTAGAITATDRLSGTELESASTAAPFGGTQDTTLTLGTQDTSTSLPTSGSPRPTDTATSLDATLQDSSATSATLVASEPAGDGEDPAPLSEAPGPSNLVFANDPPPSAAEPGQVSDTTFFSASMDGTIRVAGTPWCMGACWSPDGNRIYAGRRNGVVEEFDIHKARHGWAPERSLKFPAGSGAVSAVRAMPNGRHLICASHDILRLYDLDHTGSGAPGKQSAVPFLIVPGPPRAGVISALWVDPTCRFMLSAAGTRGWEGTSTEVLIGYEISVPSES
ncbi:unnamed protein product [Parascedosporium putredinis]|uniref:Mitochondrial division protein 1 n=1 Tax=Parascedosporium putredinis TaxID=1442378 RepID=A0A9P1H2L8_9PEZI|nr:unnamed protein product [Parascedosporium putredinis]CAI7993703.1 unnamed protein product [Parascedosporium putredinis]